MATPALVSAQNVNKAFCEGSGKTTAVCQDVKASEKTDPLLGPNGVLTTTARILSFLVGFAALVSMILAGIRYILSGGDPQKISQAKDAIIYGVVGLIVAVFAQAIVGLVLSKL